LRHRTVRRARLAVVAAVAFATVCGAGITQTFAQAAPHRPASVLAAQRAAGPAPQTAGAPGALPAAIPDRQRATVLGAEYRDSSDRAFTTSGDGSGFHLLVADEKDGYGWRTAASLSEPGFETDTWIGNACVSGSGRYAAVVYAPRTFTNKPELMSRGAFTALVDLRSGAVRKLPFQSTLGYFSPGCGTAEDVVFTQLTDDTTSAVSRTRLVTVHAASGRRTTATVPGEVTSAVPAGSTIVAARGPRIIRIDGTRVRTVAETRGTPFRIEADAGGGVTFIDQLPDATRTPTGPATPAATCGTRAAVRRVTAAALRTADSRTAPAELARGRLTGFDLARTPAGTVFITGQATTGAPLPVAVRNPGGLAKDSRVSSHGAVALTTAWADGGDSRTPQAGALAPRAARITLTALATGRRSVLDVGPGDVLGGASARRAAAAASPVLPHSATRTSVVSPQSPQSPMSPMSPRTSTTSTASVADADRTCSVPRNDPRKQAFQPTPRQIEWAVDQAVTGTLDKGATRPANWKNTGMAGYAPQSLFPLEPLSGGSGTDWHVPAQVMLGVVTQESNMWQATRYAVPGVTANPLIANFYGVPYNADGSQEDPWQIDWAKADCGYGVSQVTDGMRLPGKGQPTRPPIEQEAIALDYAANIAAGVDILIDKWNQTRADGIVINDGSPKYLENWFAALWTYNAGYHPKSEAGQNAGKWGLGWTNNPANPLWLENRTPFLEAADGSDDYSQAANPQNWPYEEKVIGWAARPISALFRPGDFEPGYRAAWWTTTANRTAAKPPIGLFCDASNDCDRSKIGTGATNGTGYGPCLLPGDPDTENPLYLKCWYTKPATWKNCVSGAQCGNPVHRFDETYPEQPDATSYPPRCSAGLPDGTKVVDDLPAGTVPAGATGRSCGAVSSAGTFEFGFGSDSARIDLHQIGAAYGNHFWFTHTESTGSPRLQITGTWTLGTSDRGWMRVWVHLPDHGAQTRQAAYTVGGSDSTSPRRVKPQRVMQNKWVSLGSFRFTGTPTVSLTNATGDGTGTEDVAWDAVAFQPLRGEPAYQVVAMGDSYTSGEGVTAGSNSDYYPESDYDDPQQPDTKDACHRSLKAWPRLALMPSGAGRFGDMADEGDPDVDFQFTACSGAATYNMFDRSKSGELPQFQQGYLDQHTSVVELSVGGNDARFSDVLKKCVLNLTGPCDKATIDLVDPDTGKDTGQQTGPLDEWGPAWIHDQVQPRVTAVLTEIHRRAPNARIILMGYPRLLEDHGQCASTLYAISVDEGIWLNQTADLMDTALQAAVAAFNNGNGATYAAFADPRDAFAGRGVCGDPEDINGVVTSNRSQADSSPQSMKSFHPKLEGAAVYATVLQQVLQTV
jgi:hypothetical protein